MRKAFFSLVTLVAVLTVVQFVFAQSGAGPQGDAAQYPTKCIPILGVTSAIEVPVLGDPSATVKNSGQIYFEQTGITEMGGANAIPHPDYRACVIDLGPQASKGSTRYLVEGWAVDSNLGWISFSCKDGKQLKGSKCSDAGIDYRTEITASGEIRGFAYSDSAGWISWDCNKGFNYMDGEQYACGNIDYSTLVDINAQPLPAPAGLDNGKFYYPLKQLKGAASFAWSDSVGWFDVIGMKIPFNDFPPKPKPACSDGIDNDDDALTDFPTDPGCSSKLDDDELNTQCNDGIDNDADGTVDFAEPWDQSINDPGCSSFADDDESDDPLASYDCNDGVDNDSDGKADHISLAVDLDGDGIVDADPGCYSAQDNSEVDRECSDWLDNDGDGTIDYLGYEHSGPDSGCDGPDDDDETNVFVGECNDGIDNDGDGSADFEGVDLNGDGDFDDLDEFKADITCVSLVDAKEDPKTGGGDHGEEPLMPQCQDKKDNDSDGWVDFPDDPGCTSFEDADESDAPLPTYDCDDGKDNDGDSKVDYPTDPGCSSPFDQSEVNTACGDGKDNDGDGLIDLKDPQCSAGGTGGGASSGSGDDPDGKDLGEHSYECSDGKDNDGDGQIDFSGKTIKLGGKDVVFPKDTNCASKKGLSESGCVDPAKVNMADDYKACVPIQEFGSWLSIVPNPYTSPVVADGVSGYNIILHLAEGSKVFDSSYTFTPTLSLENFMDFELRYRQVGPSGPSELLSFAALENAGYITDFKWKSEANSWIAHVKSPVPTNLSGEANFIVVPQVLKGQIPTANKLSLEKIEITKIEKAGETVKPVTLIPLENTAATDKTPLNFDPIIKVSELLADGQNYINAIAGVDNVIKATIDYLATGDVKIPVLGGKQIVDVNFVVSAYDEDSIPTEQVYLYDWKAYSGATIDNNINSTTTKASSFSKTLNIKNLSKLIWDNILVVPFIDPSLEDVAATAITRPSIFSYIEYKLENDLGTETINHLWAKLPSTEIEAIFNPIADITGIVASDVVLIDDEYLSEGNLTSNVVRDTVMANIAAILGNKPIPQSSDFGISSAKGWDTCYINDNGDIVELDVPGGTLYYVNGADVSFNGPHAINCDEDGAVHNILIVKGGNVFIRTDLYESEGKWSIIALGDGVGEQSYKNGGNVYIRNTVKDVMANIMADGSLFSYNGDNDPSNFEIDGRPKKETISDEDLKNQISFIGSILSKNTFGGCKDQNTGLDVANYRIPAGVYNQGFKYVAGTGKYTKDQEEACLYDLNHFRKFKVYLERYEGMPVDQHCVEAGILEDEQFAASPAKGDTITDVSGNSCIYDIDTSSLFVEGDASSGDLIDHDGDGKSYRALSAPKAGTSPVYIKYSAPLPDNAVFRQNKAVEISRPGY